MDTTQRRLYIVSDTHHWHNKLIEYTGRPQDFDEQIRDNWQRLVTPNDTVLHLGDVHVGRMSLFASVQAELPGVKCLILGNHDHEKPNWYMQRGFAMVCHSMTIGKHGEILLTHAPVIPLPDSVAVNIHGHFHAPNNRRLLADHPQANIDYYHEQQALGRYALVEIETNLSPVPLSDFCEAHHIKL